MMWELAQQAWSLTGHPLPDYPRHLAPGRDKDLADLRILSESDQER